MFNLKIIISENTKNKQSKLYNYGKITNILEIKILIRRYNINIGVVENSSVVSYVHIFV